VPRFFGSFFLAFLFVTGAVAVSEGGGGAKTGAGAAGAFGTFGALKHMVR